MSRLQVLAPQADHSPSDEALIARYDGRCPRYTSYPTAAQFVPLASGETYRAWLADLDPAAAVSLYVHVPFCQRLCWYCGCNTRAVRRPSVISDYVSFLRRELALVEEALPGKLRASGLHLGGGTPNMLSRDDLTELFAAIRHVFTLRGEIAAELDPAVLTEEWVRAAAFHGLSRASLGVQDLDPEVQRAIGRLESFEVVERAVGWLRQAGVLSVNFDLMYGLPRQTPEGLVATIDRLLTLEPQRIALFGYAHVPWMKPHQGLIDVTALPGPGERLVQAAAAAERLAAAGYVAIGLDHFALPGDDLARAAKGGDLHRNFQGYTTDRAESLIGFGASAISRLPGGYVQNEPAEAGWRKALGEGALPVARGVALTEDDRFRGEIIERLMCDLSVDLGAVCARRGRDMTVLSKERARLEAFAADGLLIEEDGRIAVTERGRPYVRAVCAVFDQYLDAGAQRHARLV
jgi:oxygen-independent coproporphyrinogen-3 oxidase